MTQRIDMVEDLKQERDELRLKMHLGSMEVRERWEALEEKWQDFAARARLRETSEDVEESLRVLGEELQMGYARVKAALVDKGS
jgi:hypothetical protein